jgi:hypothetical protein
VTANNEEAITLLESELAGFRDEPYEKLVSLMSAGSLDFERVGPSGATYQVEIRVIWDDRRSGTVRVSMVNIDLVAGRIVEVEVLYREDVRAALGTLFA